MESFPEVADSSTVFGVAIFVLCDLNEKTKLT